MLKKSTFLVYSFLFHAVSTMHLVPYKWYHKRQLLRVTTNKRENLWRIVASIQFLHFGFLTIRLVNSIMKKMKPSVLLFQFVWNALFLIPALAQITTYVRKHEIAAVATEWLRIEAQEKHLTPNALQAFFAIFLPTGAMHSLAHAFNYVQNPEQPQYLISIFLDMVNVENRFAFITFFGVVEVVLALFNWTVVIYYVSFLFGCASTIEAKIQESLKSRNSSQALEVYKSIQAFGFNYGDALVLGIMFKKIILFSCIVICVYNTIICDLPWLPFLLMPLTVVACSTVFIFCFPPVCALFNNSQMCIQKWQQSIDQTLYDKKQWNSFRPIRLNVGKFYKLDKLVVLTFFDLIITSVINIILLFPTDKQIDTNLI